MKRILLYCALLATQLQAAANLRDPTMPPLPAQHGSARRQAAPVLSGVLASNGQRVAIFNGQLVRSGSAVGPYLIEVVLADGVRYRRDGRTRELHVPIAITTFKKPSTALARAQTGVH